MQSSGPDGFRISRAEASFETATTAQQGWYDHRHNQIKRPEFQPAPQKDVSGRPETAHDMNKKSQIMLTGFGAFLLCVVSLTPVWDSFRLLYSGTYIYFNGRTEPFWIVFFCFSVIVLFIACSWFSARWSRPDVRTDQVFMFLFMSAITLLGLGMLWFSVPLETRANAAHHELTAECRTGARTASLYAYYSTLLDIRKTPECMNMASVEMCTGFEDRYPYTGFLKHLELTYGCSGFCYHAPPKAAKKFKFQADDTVVGYHYVAPVAPATPAAAGDAPAKAKKEPVEKTDCADNEKDLTALCTETPAVCSGVKSLNCLMAKMGGKCDVVNIGHFCDKTCGVCKAPAGAAGKDEEEAKSSAPTACVDNQKGLDEVCAAKPEACGGMKALTCEMAKLGKKCDIVGQFHFCDKTCGTCDEKGVDATDLARSKVNLLQSEDLSRDDETTKKELAQAFQQRWVKRFGARSSETASLLETDHTIHEREPVNNVPLWDRTIQGNGNTTHNMWRTGWLNDYPPTLFTLANYKTTCEGAAAREMVFIGVETGSLIYMEGLALFITAGMLGFLRIMAMCKTTEKKYVDEPARYSRQTNDAQQVAL